MVSGRELPPGELMTFWIVAGGLTLVTALLIGRALLRPTDAGAPDRRDIRIYQDQLRSVDKDLARGVVSDGEAERLRTEIKRRILDADKAATDGPVQAPRAATLAAACIAAFVVIGGSLWLYAEIGAPGYPDQPMEKRIADAAKLRAERPSQVEFEARMPVSPAPEISEDFARLIEQLRTAVQDRPDELEGWVLLARNESRLGNLPAARAAQTRVIELKGDAATSQDYTQLAAMLIQAAGGNVSAQADEALNAALSRDPGNPIARYYAGLMHLQTNRPDQAFQFWEPLVREGPPDAPWIPIIRARLETVAALAGINYALPADPLLAGPGPSAADMAAAAEMSPEDRQEMVQAMVDQLGRRLAEEGGPPTDWAKLIRAHGVLGNTDRAAAIWAEAQQTFSDPADIALIREAAANAGVAEGAPGPSTEDMAAAAEMAPQDRAAMIRGMVDQLGERLATEGGSPTDWARMISSLGVLGESDRAAAIWGEAQERFKQPADLDIIREAAVAAGVAE
jgi:cytochrome c-type biogenesis protein CcmH